ncbi:MAG: cyclase family protein [Rhizobiaceae bacterium]
MTESSKTAETVRVASDPIDIVLRQLGAMRKVDLAPLLERGIPRIPTHPHLMIDKAVTHERDGYYCQAIMMGEHTGAHVDAPAHMVPDMMHRTIDTFEADRLFGAAVLYDFSERALQPGDLITAADMQAEEERTGVAAGEGEIALINFGWMKRYWRTDSQARWFAMNSPGLSEDVTEMLRDRKIRAVGTDTVAAETAIVDGRFGPDPGHVKNWLPNDILIIEMLRNLEQVTKRSLFLAMPLRIHEGSGSPIRPIAFCPV